MNRERTLVAVASSGEWQCDLDRGDDNTWMLIVDRPPVYLSIALDSPSIIGAAVRFLVQTAGKRESSEIECGQCLGQRLLIVKDCEFADRYFVKLSGAETLCSFTLGQDDVSHLRRALECLMAEAAGHT